VEIGRYGVLTEVHTSGLNTVTFEDKTCMRVRSSEYIITIGVEEDMLPRISLDGVTNTTPTTPTDMRPRNTNTVVMGKSKKSCIKTNPSILNSIAYVISADKS
jgi:hypothetical protein